MPSPRHCHQKSCEDENHGCQFSTCEVFHLYVDTSLVAYQHQGPLSPYASVVRGRRERNNDTPNIPTKRWVFWGPGRCSTTCRRKRVRFTSNQRPGNQLCRSAVCLACDGSSHDSTYRRVERVSDGCRPPKDAQIKQILRKALKCAQECSCPICGLNQIA